MQFSSSPLVSIILPTYNGSRFLVKSIESCLSQTYQNIELIIVNDCSNDTTQAIAESFAAKDGRVSVINNEKNQRLPRSLNIGFSVSKGEFLTWTSDDNYYKEDAIERMVNHLKMKSVIGLVYADEWIINEEGDILYYTRNIRYNCHYNGAVADLPIYNTVGACFMYRREVFETIGEYDVAKEMVEDWDYWFRIWLEYPIEHIPIGLYFYRDHSESLTGKRSIEQQTRAIEFIKNNNLQYEDKIPDDIRLRAYLRCAGIAKRLNSKSLSRECIELALKISPTAKEYTTREILEYVFD